MLDLNITKNKTLGLYDIEATLTLPPITINRSFKDKDRIAYDLAREFSQLVDQIVEKQIEMNQDD